MQIKTYKAVSMKDALAQIKTEMGNDAMIVSTREVSDENFGIMARPMVEVTAAVDYDEALPDNSPDEFAVNTGDQILDGYGQHDEFLRMQAEMAEMKRMMSLFMSQSGIDPSEGTVPGRTLVDRGIQPGLAELMVERIGKEKGIPDIKNLLKKLIRTSTNPKKVSVFLGTTGVGKTTTAAKIAAMATVREHRKVGVINMDTYRIGAVDQGRIYANILNIPFRTVSTPDEFRLALAEFREMDMVLVDTVGRSPFSSDYISDLKTYFRGVDVCKFLLLPVAIREKEMEKTTRAFSALGIDRMIFTKADEAVTLGSIISHNLLFRTPISYITVGQRVPEDIEIATPSKIVDLCLGDI